MQDQAEHFAADIRWLLRHKDEFVQVSCPACDSEKVRGVLEKYGLVYAVAPIGGTMYMNPDLLRRYSKCTIPDRRTMPIGISTFFRV